MQHKVVIQQPRAAVANLEGVIVVCCGQISEPLARRLRRVRNIVPAGLPRNNIIPLRMRAAHADLLTFSFLTTVWRTFTLLDTFIPRCPSHNSSRLATDSKLPLTKGEK